MGSNGTYHEFVRTEKDSIRPRSVEGYMRHQPTHECPCAVISSFADIFTIFGLFFPISCVLSLLSSTEVVRARVVSSFAEIFIIFGICLLFCVRYSYSPVEWSTCRQPPAHDATPCLRRDRFFQKELRAWSSPTCFRRTAAVCMYSHVYTCVRPGNSRATSNEPI